MLENYKLSGMDGDSISEVNQYLHTQRSVWGPKTSDTRYITEDTPYGLWVTSQLGKMRGVAAPLHESGVTLFSAIYGRAFKEENNIFAEIDLERYLKNDDQPV